MKLNHLDSKLASNVEEYSDPFPGDSMFKHFESHFLKSIALGARARSHSIYGTETVEKE